MILVFVGAGGSAAVDPEQYPTTVEFFNRLPDNIKEDPLFSSVHNFLEIQKDEQPIDIEEILWTLDELQNYCKASLNTETISGWLMDGNRIHRLFGNVPDLSELLNGMRYLENQIENLTSNINALVYDFYATIPSDDKLSAWVRLLQGLAEYVFPIEIFTTNYDRVLESAINAAKINLTTGRNSDGIQTRLDTTFWDTPGKSIDNNCGLLTKLHGSVDWQLSNEGINMSEIFTGNHQQHLILYPGYKGDPVEEPFVQFHEHLRAVVQQASAAIFIGYAFRDAYINTILSQLPSEIPKFVINKDDALPDFSFLDGCKHFNDGLTKGSVETCLVGLHMEL